MVTMVVNSRRRVITHAGTAPHDNAVTDNIFMFPVAFVVFNNSA
jgi:hypothetical protein